MITENGPGQHRTERPQQNGIVGDRCSHQFPGNPHRDRDQQGHRRKGTAGGQGNGRCEHKRDRRHPFGRELPSGHLDQVIGGPQGSLVAHGPQPPGQHQDPEGLKHAAPSTGPAHERLSE